MDASKSDMSLEEERPSLAPAEGNPVTIAATSIKLPPFWPADPHIWFAQVEAQFATRKISVQKTMYEYVVASLTPEFATEVRDLILTIPEDHPYDQLKASLIKRTAASEQRRLQQLFHSEELGDRKPSQLLRRLQQLLGDSQVHISPPFLRELFLQRLPGNVRMVLASTSDHLPLEELAQLADRIMDVSPPTVAAVTPTPLPELDHLRSEVARLQSLVQQINMDRPSRQSSRSSNNSRNSSPRRPPNLCWYHFRFGDSARKCRPPCSKSGNDQASR